MKSNIDLTSNEMFSRNSFSTISKSIKRSFGKFPWNTQFCIIESDVDLGIKFEGIKTGNKNQREMKKLCEQENTGDYCDCCGAYLKSIPWDRTYGLCRKCMVYYDDKYHKKKIPWNMSSEMMIARGFNPLFWNKK